MDLWEKLVSSTMPVLLGFADTTVNGTFLKKETAFFGAAVGFDTGGHLMQNEKSIRTWRIIGLLFVFEAILVALVAIASARQNDPLFYLLGGAAMLVGVSAIFYHSVLRLRENKTHREERVLWKQDRVMSVCKWTATCFLAIAMAIVLI